MKVAWVSRGVRGAVITSSCIFNWKGPFENSTIQLVIFLIRERGAYRIERIYVSNEVIYIQKENVRYTI